MTRSLFNIFCDDIRQEVGDKLTFVGVYSNNLQVEQLPATLPKLCLSVFCTFDRARPIKHMSIDVLLGETTIAQTEIEPDRFGESDSWLEESPGVIQGNLIFSPLNITEPCVISLVVTADGEPLQSIPLDITQAPAPTE
ncbi:DUF6941 family protein [Halomonas halocynthiae]|uniref:DUF6941 family protein n=1 Tax=Halomonas halocynthiae TaxID=176290 RepID=UPI000401D216|nr:hypothetical protein [Halomonas halocynthiae]